MSNELVNKGLTIVGDCIDKDKPIVVIGTARGGTSMIAGVLNKLGVFMGDKAISPVFEDTILSAAFEKGDDESIRQIIDTYNNEHSKWGWKRPSSINYLEKVNTFLNKPLFIFIFKDVLSIAQRNAISMLTDITPTVRQALHQYLKCVDFLEAENPDALLISYDKALSDPKSLIEFIIHFYELEPTKEQKEEAINFVQPNPTEYLDASRITKAEGAVEIINEKIVSGWARYVYTEVPAEVVIYINDVEVGTAKANLPNLSFNQSLLRNQTFSYEHKAPINVDDNIRVRVRNEVVDLPLELKDFDGQPSVITILDDNIYKIGLIKGTQTFVSNMLAPGWRACKIVAFSNIFYMLLLKNDKEKDAVWFFDSQKVFIGNSLIEMQLDNDKINQILACLMNTFVSSVLHANSEYDNFVNTVNEFNDFKDEILFLLEKLKPEQVVPSSNNESIELLFGKSTKQDFISPSFDASNPKLIISFEQCEYVCRHSIVVNNFLIVYPYFNDKDEFILVFESGHDSQRFLVYDFNENTFYQSGNCYPVGLALSQFFQNIVTNYELIKDYLRSETNKCSGIVRNAHIGHNLWNDLSGIDRLQRSSSFDSFESILITGGALVEPWGRLEDLFNIEASKIRRDIRSESDLVDYVLGNNVLAFRLTDDYISDHLANNLIENFRYSLIKVMPREENELRVVFGLRLENRTWINQKEGLKAIMIHLSSLFTKVTIYVDGHDVVGSSGHRISSHHESSESDIVGLERDVLNFLSSPDKPSNVSIVDGISMDLGESINWINSSDFFIAPWGAGLAKYKWVCNLPGVIFTSNWNKQHKPDLKIYELERFREYATDCTYVDSNFIQDDLSSVLNVKVAGPEKNPSRANFHVDIDGLKKTIDEFISKGSLDV